MNLFCTQIGRSQPEQRFMHLKQPVYKICGQAGTAVRRQHTENSDVKICTARKGSEHGDSDSVQFLQAAVKCIYKEQITIIQ